MRKLFVVANWKCNPTTLKGAKLLFIAVKKGIKNVKNIETIICPPFIYLSDLAGMSSRYDSNLKLGGQDCFWEERGACTGEISPLMLKNAGISYVIIGHSERRKHHKETDELINRKMQAALQAGLRIILCIDKIIQIKKDLKDIKEEQLKNLIIAYEPVFAIGTGKPCSIKKAAKMRNMIENILKVSPVLYGGSVNSQNAKSYIEEAGFQGLLVGGASLNPKEFVEIIQSVNGN